MGSAVGRDGGFTIVRDAYLRLAGGPPILRDAYLRLAGVAAVFAAALVATRAPTLLLAGAGFAGMTAVAVGRLRAAILVVIALVGVLPIGLYAEISPAVPLVTASRVLIGVVVMATLIQVLRGHLHVRRWALWPALALWLAAVVLSWPDSIDPQTTELRLFSEFLETAALAGVVYLVFDRSSYRHVLIAVTVGVALNAAIALLDFAGLDPMASIRERADAVTGRGNTLVSAGDIRLGFQRVQGTFQHPSFLGAYLAMLAPVIYALAIVARPIPRRWLTVVLLLCLIGLGLTVTRAAWLAGGIALIWVWAAAIRRGWQRLWAHAWVVSTIAVVAIVANPGLVAGLDDLFRDLFVTQGSASTATSGYRLLIHEQVLAAVGERPWFGFGANTFDQIGIIGYTQGFTVQVTSADSHLLRLLAEVGIVGALAFAILLVVSLASVSAARARADRGDAVILTGVLAGLTGFTVVNLTISAFAIAQDGYIFWILVGAACASRFRSSID
jgi:O-antigen ligase